MNRRTSIWRRTVYALTSLPVGAVCFVVTLIGVTLATVLSITMVGSVLFVAVFALTSSLTRFELRRADLLLGVPESPPDGAAIPYRSGVIGRIRDGRRWREVGYLLLALPLGMLSFALTATMFFLLARAVVYPIMAWGDPTVTDDAWGGPSFAGAMLVHSGPGALVLLFGSRVLQAVTELQSRAVRRLLTPAPKVARLRTSPD
ncbi:hypothetical protein GCM10027589_15060 [Actinocorallia lasiicapitis]